MRIKYLILLLYLISPKVLEAQSATIKVAMLDSLLIKNSRVLALEMPSTRNEYPTRIRIIDLTKQFSQIEVGYLKEIHYRIVNKLPFDLNSGEYRDIVIVNYKKKNKIIQVTTAACEFIPNFSVQRQFVFVFVFKLQGNEVIINSKQTVYE